MGQPWRCRTDCQAALASAQLGSAASSAGPSSLTAAGLWPLAGRPSPSGQLVGNPTGQTLSPASITVNVGAQSQAAVMLQDILEGAHGGE